MPSGRRRGNLASTDSPFPTTQVCAGDRRRHPGRAGLVSNPPGPGRPAGNGPAGNGEGRAGPDRRRIVSRGGRVAGEDGPEAGDPGLYLRVCVCVRVREEGEGEGEGEGEAEGEAEGEGEGEAEG